jgi:UDP-2-acetamido-3-amino-2,3-dideoxy-glucuronate N-acetyltransferase
MLYLKHGSAEVLSKNIGIGTRIWQYVVILPNAIIGDDCNICAHCLIENDVVVGDRVTIKSGVQLWDGLRIKNDVFIGPNATFANDLYPRSKVKSGQFLRTLVEEGASIGAGATILPGLTIGRNAMVGAGAVVTRSIPPNAIATGNPAKIVGYVDSDKVNASSMTTNVPDNGSETTNVVGVTLHRMACITDIRGSISVGEFSRTVPFVPKRFFTVFDVPTYETRGEHAHRECHQFLVCINGSCAVVADDGMQRQELVLDRPDIGLYLPPLIWGIQYKFTNEAVLLVFASHFYDSADYIRSYSEFRQVVGEAK